MHKGRAPLAGPFERIIRVGVVAVLASEGLQGREEGSSLREIELGRLPVQRSQEGINRRLGLVRIPGYLVASAASVRGSAPSPLSGGSEPIRSRKVVQGETPLHGLGQTNDCSGRC